MPASPFLAQQAQVLSCAVKHNIPRPEMEHLDGREATKIEYLDSTKFAHTFAQICI